MTDPEFSFIDEVPEAGNPTAINPDGLYCEVCGTVLEYSGRGRKPKYCSDHKPGKTTGNTAARRGSGAVVDRAISELSALYGVAGQGIKYIEPVAGTAIYLNRDKLADSYRMLLETNARFRKLFTELESKAAWLPIIAVHADIVMMIIALKTNQRPLETPDESEPEPVPDNVHVMADWLPSV